ncbi:MAG: C4-dicarboxylic acid transporter DauA [Phycisphaerales bacterium]|nr:C4-dicarboxylic acid transporter DauA [Phycisphaerales bacterium]
MRKRFESIVSMLPALRHGPGFAMRQTFAEGYGIAKLRADVLAGIVVGIVALPLSMALAIASGVPPQHGLYTAIGAGAAIALLGGSRVQVSGPTAAFVVILAPIAARFGLGGLCLATLMAGVILVGMGLGRLGQMVSFIPYPVTTGFTAGIAVVIATLQLKDFLGLDTGPLPSAFIEKVGTIARAVPTAHWPDALVGAFTLALLLLWPRVTRRIPAPLVAITAGAAGAWILEKLWPGTFSVATIGTRFSAVIDGKPVAGIPQLPPLPLLPWRLPGPNGEPLVLNLELFRALIGPAFAIAMLGAIESLLSAVVADGMTGMKHDSDAELMAQGVGNILAPFLGGFAATGAIARTATNVRSGGRSPIAAVVHALFVLAAVIAAAPLLAYLPMASMAALLLLVAWNMSEVKHFVRMVRTAPQSDVAVLLTCFGLTVAFDMVIAVSVGIVLAALLFIRRMAEVSSVRLVGSEHRVDAVGLPPTVVLYEIAGPLFFGAAQKAMSSLRTVEQGVQVVVLDMRDVPAMDATGLVNLESTVDRLESQQVYVVLAGVQAQPRRVLAKGGLAGDDRLAVCSGFDEAIEIAKRRVST